MQKITRDEPKMWGSSIVGFGSYDDTYASGRSGDWPLTGFPPRKQGLTLSIMTGLKGHEKLLAKLGKSETGKACLHIKKLDDVDRKALETLIEESLKEKAKGGS